MSLSARKSSATNGRTPLRLGHLLRTSRSRVSHLKSLLMDNVAYYEHARLTVRHSSGTSFTPGAPLHSACLGSPEFYRRNEGDGWLGFKKLSFLRFHLWIFQRDGRRQTKTRVKHDASVTFRLSITGASMFLSLLTYIRYPLSGYFYFQGFTSWEPRRNSSMALLFAFGF